MDLGDLARQGSFILKDDFDCNLSACAPMGRSHHAALVRVLANYQVLIRYHILRELILEALRGQYPHQILLLRLMGVVHECGMVGSNAAIFIHFQLDGIVYQTELHIPIITKKISKYRRVFCSEK